MIEITHQQAQRLIRESLDRPVDEPQWNTLQAHLETCPECRAYRDRRLGLLRNLARLLHERWWTVMLDGRAFPGLMAARHSQHARWLRGLRYALLALIVFVGLAGALLYRRAARLPASSEASGAQAAVTLTPSPGTFERAGSFRGQVVFEGAVEGASAADRAPGPGSVGREIYLLSPGPAGSERTNLTQHPADDYAPVWSPDGQWIAFLSNRDIPSFPEKSEIYVMSIAGTRLTRLTADPNLRWQPPLTWSADGRYLAAAAISPAVPDGAVYLLSLEEAGRVRAVPGSVGGRWPSFSPAQQRLAFQVTGVGGQQAVFVYDLRRSLPERVSGALSGSGRLQEGLDGGLNWSAFGERLLYLAYVPHGPAGEPLNEAEWQVRLAYNAGERDALNLEQIESAVTLRFPASTPIRAAAYSPTSQLFYVRENAYGSGCAGLVRQAGTDPLSSTVFAGGDAPLLCLDGSIERASWSQDGVWLVAAGRVLPGEPGGIIAMRFPPVTANSAGRRDPQVVMERLADLPPAAGALRVRPDRPSVAGMMTIDPRPAPAGAQEQQLPNGLLDTVLVARAQNEENGWVSTIAGIERGRLADLGSPRMGRCPRRSPDGERIAYVSGKINTEPGWEALFVAGLPGGKAQQVSTFDGLNDDDFRGHMPWIGGLACPSWSPDGQRLAMYITTDKGVYLAVFPAQAGRAPASFFPAYDANAHIPPQWTTDSQRLIVARSGQGSGEARIVTIDPDTEQVVDVAPSDGWQRVGDLAYSPDGHWLGYLAQTIDDTSNMASVVHIASIAGDGDIFSGRLPDYTAGGSVRGYTDMTWFSDNRPDWMGRLGLVFQGKVDEGVKSALMVFDLATLDLTVLAAFEEDLQAAAWSPDGNWVIYSLPSSGMWALNVPAALAGKGAPTWLGIQPVDEINWR